MMKPKLLSFFLMAAFGLPAAADNLSEVYRAALAYDASYAAAQAAYRAAQEKTPQARAGLLPNASLNANTRRNDVDTPSATANSTPGAGA